MNRREALHQFWNSFGVTAYEENVVPKEPVFPYITYEAKVAGWGEPFTVNASIWDDTQSWRRLNALSETIEKAIRTLSPVAYDGGMYRVWIGQTPFSQNMGDTDPKILRIVLTVNFEFMDIDF